MNFLPLIITFLLIFSAISMSFMTSQSNDKTEGESYKGRLRALRSAYNKTEELLYDEYKVSSGPKVTNSTSKEREEKEERTYFRITRMGSPHGSINLSELIRHPENLSNVLLYEKTILYLEQVYGKASFVKELKDPNWAKELLDSIIEQQQEYWKEKNDLLSLERCVIDGPLKTHYAKLIRGTNSFDAEMQKGYLPLEACIHFRNKSEKAINFHFASPGLLIVLFGKESFEKIKQEEWPNGKPAASHYKKYALKDENKLKKVIGKAHELKAIELLDFSFPEGYKIPKRATDPSTFISAQLWEDPNRG